MLINDTSHLLALLNQQLRKESGYVPGMTFFHNPNSDNFGEYDWKRDLYTDPIYESAAQKVFHQYVLPVYFRPGWRPHYIC